MKFLVTGGCGAIGSPLVKALISVGHRVSVLDDCSRGSKDRLEDVPTVNWFGDICNPAFVHEAMKVTKPDWVIHLAAVNGTANFYTNPSRVLEVGVKGIVNVMDACVAHGVHRILVASSSEVYAEPLSYPTTEKVALKIPDVRNPRYSYSGGKILSELMAMHYGNGHFTRSLIVRPHNVYGPNMGEDHVIPQLIRKLEKLPQGCGKKTSLKIDCDEYTSRAFCYIDDAVAGIMTVLDRGVHQGIYNIGTDHEVTIYSLASRLATLMGRSPLISEGTDCKQGSPSRRCPSIAELESLGWEPKVPLWEGLKKTVEWYTTKPVEKS